MDITTLTDLGTDLGVAVAAAGALFLTALVAAKTFPFIGRWVGKLFRAGSGQSGS